MTMTTITTAKFITPYKSDGFDRLGRQLFCAMPDGVSASPWAYSDHDPTAATRASAEAVLASVSETPKTRSEFGMEDVSLWPPVRPSAAMVEQARTTLAHLDAGGAIEVAAWSMR
jgi:hypothetical protein